MLLGDAQTLTKSICYLELPKLMRIQFMNSYQVISQFRDC